MMKAMEEGMELDPATDRAGTGGAAPSRGSKATQQAVKPKKPRRRRGTQTKPATPAMVEAAKASWISDEEKARKAAMSREEKKVAFSEVRAMLFEKSMNRELPTYRQLGFDNTTDPLDLNGQIAISQVIQAGLAAKVLLWSGDGSIHLQEPLLKDAPYVLDALHARGWDVGSLTPVQRSRAEGLVEQSNEARYAFAAKNLGFATMMAAREKKKRELDPYTFGEILEESKLGVMYAVDKYDPTSGFKFSTFATWWVVQKIHAYIDEKSQLIRMSTPLNMVFRNVAFAEKDLRRTYANDDDITDEVLAQWMIDNHRDNITLKSIKEAKAMRRETVSLDNFATEDGNKTIQDYMESDENLEAAVMERLDSPADFEALLSFIDDPLCRDVVREWYSSDMQKDAAITGMIARKYGLSRDSVKELRRRGEEQIRLAVAHGELDLDKFAHVVTA